jgi:hypothetical protein
MNPFPRRRALFLSTAMVAALLSGAGSLLFGVCGPFTDVAADSFCPFVLEVFYTGITTGTTPTTYSPADNVTRLQMAAFLSRSVDRVLQRGGHRAALNQYWTPGAELSLGLTSIGTGPSHLKSDGEDLWVGNSGLVTRVHASDGRVLGTWTGADTVVDLLVASGRVFAAGSTNPGRLYRIDPSQPAGAVTTVASNLGNGANGIAFDGIRIWTANSTGGSVSIVTPAAAVPWPVITVSSGFTLPSFALYDGANIWVIDQTARTLLKLDGVGTILQTVTVGITPRLPVFDGTNIWVPSFSEDSVTVVRAASGAVLATLTGNGLNGSGAAAFDGQRILVTNSALGENSVSLFKAADLTPLGAVGTGAGTIPNIACSDGTNFWITFAGTGQLARF